MSAGGDFRDRNERDEEGGAVERRRTGGRRGVSSGSHVVGIILVPDTSVRLNLSSGPKPKMTDTLESIR